MHFLHMQELSGDQLHALLLKGIEMKRNPRIYDHACERKGLLLLFQKTSTRTNLSFQSGMMQMGGYTVVMDWEASNFGLSPIRYEARYVSTSCDLIMARLKKHEDVLKLAQHSSVPVINGCCDKYHPCQALADLMTVYEGSGTFDGITMAYIGIHNNVANSLVEACMKLGVKLLLVTPIINPASWDEELMRAAIAGGMIERLDSAQAAIARAEYVYTDTWIDMEFYNDPGYAEEKRHRIETMLPFQLNPATLNGASPYIMHDMPIHPDFEIAEELIESERSVIYRQAENRMHAQKALMLHLLGAEAAL